MIVGYQYANTFIPHFMMLITYMARRNRCIIIRKEIVDYVVPQVGYSYGMLAGLGGGIKSFLHRFLQGMQINFIHYFSHIMTLRSLLTYIFTVNATQTGMSINTMLTIIFTLLLSLVLIHKFS